MYGHRMYGKFLGAAFFLLLAGLIPRAPRAQAGMILADVAASSSTVTVGRQVEVSVKVDLEQNILGFGFDLLFDDALFKVAGVRIAKPFLALAAADGDGLAGPGLSARRVRRRRGIGCCDADGAGARAGRDQHRGHSGGPDRGVPGVRLWMVITADCPHSHRHSSGGDLAACCGRRRRWRRRW